MYDWTKSAIDEKGDKCEVKAVSYFMFASLRKMQADPNFKDQYIQDYLKAASIIDAQIKVAEAANNEKELKTLKAYQTAVETGFANSGAADCETLQNVYASKIEENKTNLDFLKQTIALLRKSRCQEIELILLLQDMLMLLNRLQNLQWAWQNRL